VKQYIAFVGVVLVAWGLLAPLAYAKEVHPTSQVEGVLRTVYRVNHVRHYLVIDDMIFHMPLNFKVYVLSAKGKVRLVNRYAIQEGQSVYVGVSGTPHKQYVDVLIIKK
jgi:hypothetical protein